MTTACRNIHINDIQCKFADLAYKQSQALSIGRTCSERVTAMTIVASYLPMLYCYKTFDATVTYAYNFVFTKNNDDPITIDIIIGPGLETFTYSGTGNSYEITNYFLQQILANTTYAFEGFIHQGALFIYSYDTSLSFTTTTTVVDSNDITVTTNMEDSYESILDIWNCITAEQVCAIINNAKKLTGECNCS
jgi:hypothetical protein